MTQSADTEFLLGLIQIVTDPALYKQRINDLQAATAKSEEADEAAQVRIAELNTKIQELSALQHDIAERETSLANAKAKHEAEIKRFSDQVSTFDLQMVARAKEVDDRKAGLDAREASVSSRERSVTDRENEVGAREAEARATKMKADDLLARLHAVK